MAFVLSQRQKTVCADCEFPVRKSKNGLWCPAGICPWTSTISCVRQWAEFVAPNRELELLTLPYLYILEVALYCRFKCELVQGRDVHQCGSRGWDIFRIQQHRTATFERLPSEVGRSDVTLRRANRSGCHVTSVCLGQWGALTRFYVIVYTFMGTNYFGTDHGYKLLLYGSWVTTLIWIMGTNYSCMDHGHKLIWYRSWEQTTLVRIMGTNYSCMDHGHKLIWYRSWEQTTLVRIMGTNYSCMDHGHKLIWYSSWEQTTLVHNKHQDHGYKLLLYGSWVQTTLFMGTNYFGTDHGYKLLLYGSWVTTLIWIMGTNYSCMDHGHKLIWYRSWEQTTLVRIMGTNYSCMDHGYKLLRYGSWVQTTPVWIMGTNYSGMDHGIEDFSVTITRVLYTI
ncbi:hypothetical protein J6590_058954 [Homalodisca vitripennis]|nr:hypothetical protein J6590_058954 [Homalodisca vitripennis]